MEAARYLTEQGFTVEADDGRLLVSPADRLTDELRHWIRSHRDSLVDEIARASVPANDVPLSAKLRALGQPIALEVDDVVVCWLASDEDAQQRTDLNPRITGEEAEALTQFSEPEIRGMLAMKAQFGGTLGEDYIDLPASVRCIDCKHFVRRDHPHLGRCAAGVRPDGAAGLWDTDTRMCRHYESKRGGHDES